MTASCDLCGETALQEAHAAEGSTRRLKVYVCTSCGLTQSLPRIDRAPRRDATISSGADWGNLRYGKGFRVPTHMAWLSAMSIPEAPVILDVGANRGAFIAAALKRWPKARITAIEPDARVIAPYADHQQVTLIHERLENIHLPDTSFDLVYSSHTLEHLAAPRAALIDHARVLKPGGQMLLEVPNIALIADDDIVEEWFIDKHLFHFSPVTLSAMAVSAGLRIFRTTPEAEHIHLTLALARDERAPRPAAKDPREAARAAERIEIYRATRARNRETLRSVAEALHARPGRTVIWGGGRLFDSLVLHGHLDVSRLAGLIDKNLGAHAVERHGLGIRPPADLVALAPDTIFIASRDFAEEIAREARALAPDADILTYTTALLAADRAGAVAVGSRKAH